MNGNDFMRLAVVLSAKSGEAELRSAVSRAYYGAYHTAVELIAGVCCIVLSTGPGAHGEVPRILNHLGTEEGRRASSRLDSLHRNRNHADYDLSDSKCHDPRWVQHRIRDALEIIALIQQHSPTDEAMIKIAREYATSTLGRPLRNRA